MAVALFGPLPVSIHEGFSERAEAMACSRVDSAWCPFSMPARVA